MKTVIEMAREAGWMHEHDSETGFVAEAAFKFAELVRADERARLQPKKIKKVQGDDYCKGDERYYANE